MWRLVSGLALLTAVPLGLLIGRSRLIEDVIMTPIEVLRPIPGVAWIPLAILMFPTAEQSMIFICFLGAIFPILLSTIHGVENLDRRLIYAAQSLGAGTWPIFREVVLPGAMPSIVTGLTIGMGTCWFLVVTAEMISGQFGIGYFTWESYTMQKYPDIIVGMLVIGVLGMASSALIRFLGKRLTPWQQNEGSMMSQGAIALENVTLAFGEGRNAVTALKSLSSDVTPGRLPFGSRTFRLRQIESHQYDRWLSTRPSWRGEAWMVSRSLDRAPIVASFFNNPRSSLGNWCGRTSILV